MVDSTIDSGNNMFVKFIQICTHGYIITGSVLFGKTKRIFTN